MIASTKKVSGNLESVLNLSILAVNVVAWLCLRTNPGFGGRLN